MRTRHRTAIALTLAMLGALTACGRQEASPTTAPTTSAPTPAAAASTEQAPTTESASATAEPTTEEPTGTRPTTEESTPTPVAPTTPPSGPEEPTSEDATSGNAGEETYPDTREGYVEALLAAWTSGDPDAIDALSGDEVEVVGRCIGGTDAGWQLHQDEGDGPYDLGWAGYPGLLMAMTTLADGGQAWIYLEEAALGGPDAVIGVDVTWRVGSLEVAPDCFAHDVVDALEDWADGDPSTFEAMLAPDQPTTMDQLADWGYTNGGHELSGLWAFGAYEDLPADLVVIARSEITGDDQMPPALILDPQVLRTTTEGSITRATIATEGKRF